MLNFNARSTAHGAALCVLLVGFMGSSGSASDGAVSTREEVDFISPNPCTGEGMHYSGTLHMTVRAIADFEKNMLFITATANLQNATLVGLDTGTVYIPTSQPYHETFIAKLLGPAPEDPDTWDTLETEHITNRELQIAPGGGPSVYVRFVSTVLVLDGEVVKVFHEQPVLECAG